jgi:single-strand DNA-binding protein
MSNFSINRVVLVGRLTRDPELRSLPSGSSVCSLRVACNESRLGADGERSEYPNYFDVSVFGAAGESVARFLAKGRRIGLDGRLQWREWETAEGQHRQAVSIIADVVQFLDSPGTNRSAVGGEDQLLGGEDGGEGELDGVGVDDLEVVF